jgi:hypothetical protein
MSRRSAKRAIRKPEEASFVPDHERLRQPAIDAQPPRNPVFDAIGRGLIALGEKVNRHGFDPGRI